MIYYECWFVININLSLTSIYHKHEFIININLSFIYWFYTINFTPFLKIVNSVLFFTFPPPSIEIKCNKNISFYENNLKFVVKMTNIINENSSQDCNS